MFDKVKAALRLTTSIYDDEIHGMIRSAMADLGLVGIDQMRLQEFAEDELVRMAVITYCRMHFGTPDDFDRLKRSYDEQKAQLITATGYGLEALA